MGRGVSLFARALSLLVWDLSLLARDLSLLVCDLFIPELHRLVGLWVNESLVMSRAPIARQT